MARLCSIPQEQARYHGGLFHAPYPIGIVLHRTEASYKRVHKGFVEGGKRHVSAHFLIGKHEGEVVQVVDTNQKAYHVGSGANSYFVGIEFESIAARKGIHGTDPLVNADPLTDFQVKTGRKVIEWLCATHGIPRKGPPTKFEMAGCQGLWRGLLNHRDLRLAPAAFPHASHGDALRREDWQALLPYGPWQPPAD